MNYAFEPNGLPVGLGAVYAVLFALTTAGICLIVVRRKIAFRLVWIFAYVLVWAVLLQATTYVAKVPWRSTSGYGSFDGTVFDSEAKAREFAKIVSSPEFKLQCARHLAPHDDLVLLLNRFSTWDVTVEVLETKLHFPTTHRLQHYDLNYAIEINGISTGELPLVERWMDVWRIEAFHVAAFAFGVVGREAKVSLNTQQPIYMIGENEDSFDYPPRSACLRKVMRRLIDENKNAGLTAYCNRQLVAAGELDHQHGFALDPLCGAK